MGAHFLTNISLLGFIFAIWFLIGIGPLFAILPIRGLRLAIFLAPLLGCVIMASFGLCRIGVFFLPLHSVIQSTVLILLSVLLVFLFRRKWIESGSYREILQFLCVPLLFAVFFSTMFSRSGYELLSGSQDELRYSSIADHMHRFIHTGLPEDVPVLRADHWVYDFPTRLDAYAQDYRRGAELTLENTMSWSGLSAEESFPLTVGVAFLSLLFSLVFIGRFVLNFSENSTFLLQSVFASAAYFIVLHIQGSLANLCSVGIFLSAICLAETALVQRSWRWAALAGILAGGTFVFYSEIVLILWCFPVFFLVGESLVVEEAKQRKQLFRILIFLLGIAVLVANMGLFAFYRNLVANLGHAAHTVFQPAVQTNSITLRLLAPTHWMPVAVLFGLSSWFDPSYFTSLSNRLFISHSVATVTFVALIFFVGVYGFLRKSSRLSRSFALVLCGLICLVTLNFLKNEDFLLYRSSGYSVPFVFIGMVRLVDGWSHDFREHQKSVRIIFEGGGVAIAAALWLFNLNIAARTAHYVWAEDVSTDKIIRRLNPNAYVWTRLRDELKPSSNTPVLITGFKGLTVSNWIVNAIHPIPHFLGKGERESIWGYLPGPHDLLPLYGMDISLGTRINEKDLEKLLVVPNWKIDLPKFVKNSKQAIIPPHGDFPTDWAEWEDIYTHRRVEFLNIGDVIYKEDMAAVLEPSQTGPLKSDAVGLYRMILGSSNVLVNDRSQDCFHYRLVYDGKPGDLAMQSSAHVIESKVMTDRLRTEISGEVRSSEIPQLKLSLVSSKGVKLRHFDWTVAQCRIR